MEPELFNKQQKDWEQLVKEQSLALDKLVDNEMQIRKEHGFTNKLPSISEQKIQSDRKAWLQEWNQKLADNARLPTENEIDDMHHQYLGNHENEHERLIQEHINDSAKPEHRSKTITADEFMTYLSDNKHERDGIEHIETIKPPSGELPAWHKDWSNLMDEHRAIRNYYEETNKPIPMATERRMTRNIATFKQQWNIEQPEVPLDQLKTLDREDLQHPFQSWRSLMTEYNVIEHHYGIAGHDIPEATAKRLSAEIDNYDREIAAYKTSEDFLDNEAQVFQEQLKKANEQNQQHKPKLR